MMTTLFTLLGLLPSFAWLIFFLKEDIHPEPKKMVLKVFFTGFFITFVVVALQFLFQDIFEFFNLKDSSPFPIFIFALSEEVLKFAAVYLVIRKSKFFDEPIDAMIYMIVAALGFAMIENLAIMLSIKEMSEAIGVVILRFVGATLLHALSAAVIGYWWAKGIIVARKYASLPAIPSASEKSPNVNMNCPSTFLFWREIAIGIAVATVLHAFFNYLIIMSKDAIVYPVIFLTIMAMFIFWDFEKIKQS